MQSVMSSVQKIVDVSPESVIIELTGAQNKLNAFIELLNGFKITELARTADTGFCKRRCKFKINILVIIRR